MNTVEMLVHHSRMLVAHAAAARAAAGVLTRVASELETVPTSHGAAIGLVLSALARAEQERAGELLRQAEAAMEMPHA